MSQTVITEAFEQWKAQQAANGQTIILDEFVFANVPNLDVSAPIDRAAGMPPAAQIVYRQAVEKTGLVNQNAVVYSVTLGADVGDFSFNWIGLINKATGTLAMVVHAPVQSKVKNANGQQGNVLTRSFLMEYNGAETQTLISTPAETWQIDFTARMAGMDEALRLANLDVYGAGAFFENGFLVNKTGNQYYVTTGVGYIGGLRGALAANTNITVTAKPMTVWADVSYSGTLTSAYQTEIKFTLATALTDYEQSGIKHYVFALASIDANGAITDLRPKGSSLYLRKDKNLTDIADRDAALDTLNGVPKTRKVNNKDLTADIALNPADVGALPAGGTAVAATKLATVRKIAGVAFDGTADISLTPESVGALSSGGTAVAATKLATARKIAGVGFDGTKDIDIAASDVGALPAGGTAIAATKLATARKIAGVAFDGTKDIAIAAPDVGALPLTGGTLTGSLTLKQLLATEGLYSSNGYIVCRAIFDNGNQYSRLLFTDAQGSQNLAYLEADYGKNLVFAVNSRRFIMDAQGNFFSPVGVYDSGQRVYSPNNPQAIPAKSVASLGATGWSRNLDTGEITQWGSFISGSGQIESRYFPIAFPNACAVITGSVGVQASGNPAANFEPLNNMIFNSKLPGQGYGVYWIAKGY